jgi:phytoene dehydrogenase-like protein
MIQTTPGSGRTAVVVGAGPNGLTAAARLARAGWAVTVYEAAPTIGGGSRTAELIEPGVRHDVCAAVHPSGVASPAFAALGLDQHGLRWRHPDIPLVHPLDGGRAGVLHRSLDATVEGLPDADGRRWRRLMGPLLDDFEAVAEFTQGPMLRWPAHPIVTARFGWRGAGPATWAARRFEHPEAQALLAGLAAHACLPLNRPLTAGMGVTLGLLAHAVGWPVAEGGSQAIVDALAGVVVAHGGRIVTDHLVEDLRDLGPADAVLADVTPRQLVAMADGRLDGWRGRAYRRYRYGWGASKVDYVLSGPMPWSAEAARRAGTVHLGGTLAEVVASERAVHRGAVPGAPYVLVAQATVADPTRAPAGRHTVWAYCHVPHASPVDATSRMEAQFDRFAPGWRDLVVGRSVRTAPDLADYNPNVIGGDFAGGSMGGRQLVARPRVTLNPYRTPLPGVWLCSASTPPGAAVHGMCGWHAAARVLAATGGRPGEGTA